MICEAAGCVVEFSPRVVGGVAKRFCSPSCKKREANLRMQARRTPGSRRLEAARAAEKRVRVRLSRPPAPLVTCACDGCDVQFPSVGSGATAKRCCSRACTYRNAARRLRSRDPRGFRDKELRREYGLSADRVERLLHLQGGACALCRKPISFMSGRGGLNVDHCHISGVVRGLLCAGCNTSLGKLGDSPHAIRKLLAYLEAPR